MRKRKLAAAAALGAFLWGYWMTASVQATEIPIGIRNQLRGFNYFENRAYSLSVLGLDMLLDMNGLTLREWIRPGSTTGALPDQRIELINRRNISYSEVRKMKTRKSFTHFTVVGTEGKQIVCGLNFSGYSPGGNRVPMKFESLSEIAADVPASAGRYDLIRECGFGNLVARGNRNPETMFLLNPDFSQRGTIVLKSPILIRRVWKISEGEYLVLRFPFFCKELFSMIDKAGRVTKEFYPVDHSERKNLRAFFLNNLFAADYAEGKVFVTLVYPDSSKLRVDEVDMRSFKIRRMEMDIAGFSGRNPRFTQAGIVSLGKARIAAVNGVFAAENKVIVSLTLNDKKRGDEFFFTLFICFGTRYAFSGHR